MLMKIATLADLKVVGKDQDVVFKRAPVNSHIIIINPKKGMHLPQIKTKAKSLCRNMTMTMPATVVA